MADELQGPPSGPQARGPLRVLLHARRRRSPRRLADLYDAGVLRPTLDRTFAFDETPDALSFLEQGRAKGKVVVTRSPAEE